MRLKDDSVEVNELSTEAWAAVWIADDVHEKLTGKELVITSGHEMIKHSVPRSTHHRRDAIDVRRWYVDDENLTDEFEDELKARLGVDYVVIREATHFHIHWAPIYKGGNDA